MFYVNKDNLELRSVLDLETAGGDTEFWEEERAEIEKEWENYLIMGQMESQVAFGVMEGFVEEVDDYELKTVLSGYLEGKNPFANFKKEIEKSSYAKKWFAFRIGKYENYVKSELEKEILNLNSRVVRTCVA